MVLLLLLVDLLLLSTCSYPFYRCYYYCYYYIILSSLFCFWLPLRLFIAIIVTVLPGVTYISEHRPPIKYLLNLLKTDKVSAAKQQLNQLLGRPADSELVVAEVLDSHISRILVGGERNPLHSQRFSTSCRLLYHCGCIH